MTTSATVNLPAGTEHLARRIADAGQAVVSPNVGPAAATRAVALMAAGDTVTVVTDMTGVGDTYGLLSDAGHTGDIRFTSPQTMARRGAPVSPDTVLAIDIGGLSRASAADPHGRAAVLALAAQAPRVVLFATDAAPEVGAVVNQLRNRGAQFTLIDAA